MEKKLDGIACPSGVCVVRAAVFVRNILSRDVLADLIVLSPVRKPPRVRRRRLGGQMRRGGGIGFVLPPPPILGCPPVLLRSSPGQLGHCESKGFPRHSLRSIRYLGLSCQKESPKKRRERENLGDFRKELLCYPKSGRFSAEKRQSRPVMRYSPTTLASSRSHMKHEFFCTPTAYQMPESTLVSGALTHALSAVVLISYYN